LPGCGHGASFRRTRARRKTAALRRRSGSLIGKTIMSIRTRLLGTPRLLLGVCAYLLALPFFAPQIMSIALVALTAAFIMTPDRAGAPEPGYRFMVPVLPFLAAQLLAVARAPDHGLASAVLSFELPGLVLFIIMLRRTDWPLRAWMVGFSLFSAALCLSVIAGWVQVRMGAKLPVLVETPEGALLYSHSWLLAIPNDICASAILLVCPLSLLGAPDASRALRALGIVTVALTFLTMVILRTRTGFLVAGAEVAVASLVWRRVLLVIVPAALLLAAGDAWIGSHTIEKLFYDNNMDNHGVAGRLGLWASAWAMFMDAKLLGHGAQSFGRLHRAYLPDWSPRFPERRVLWAHSLFLETLAEQGVIGLIALSILLLHPVPTSCLVVMKSGRGPRLSLNIVLGLAGLAGFCVAAALELTFIRRWIPIVMFAVIGFAAKALQQHRAAQAVIQV
jgi:O-antigen ligase